jgi:hypothetical protein
MGRSDLIEAHVLLGDPAMEIDMGPPLIEMTVNDTMIDGTYLVEADSLDTLSVVAGVRDEQAIALIDLDLVEGSTPLPVPAGDYTETALTDTQYSRSRVYEVAYEHELLLGTYDVRLTATDLSGLSSALDFGVSTGSAVFYAGEEVLEEGGTLVAGQTVKVLVTRPVAFTAEDLAVTLDGEPVSGLPQYQMVMKDGEGKQWEVSFLPALSSGTHTLVADVRGLKATRSFLSSPADFDLFANGSALSEDGVVGSVTEFMLVVRTSGGITAEDIEVTLDQEPLDLTFQPNQGETEWTAEFTLTLEPGPHRLAVDVMGIVKDLSFTVSSELLLTDVSAYPNPFASSTYIFYSLSGPADRVILGIYTVTGRRVLETDIGREAGYNQYMWDGRDSSGDRIANGTYVYRIVARSESGDKEFMGRLVKVE